MTGCSRPRCVRWRPAVIACHDPALGGMLASCYGSTHPNNPEQPEMKYLHTMVRISDVAASLDFYVNKLGLKELRRVDHPAGRFSLIFLAAPGDESAQVELT